MQGLSCFKNVGGDLAILSGNLERNVFCDFKQQLNNYNL